MPRRPSTTGMTDHRLLTLHDILVAWRDGAIDDDEALSRSRIADEDALREAGMLSGVLPSGPLTEEEREHNARVDRVLAAVYRPMTGTELLASGRYIHIARDDTPPRHVIRLHPDGREELIEVDWEAARRVLG